MSSSVKTTTAVQMHVIDLPSSSGMELAPADPEQCLPPSECIQYVPAAVALCPPNSPLQAANVFKWSAGAILGTVVEATQENDSAFDHGGLVEMVLIPCIDDLQHSIRDRYYHHKAFDKDCKDLDDGLTDVWRQFLSKQLLRSRTGEVDLDLDCLRPWPCLLPSYPEDFEDSRFSRPPEDFEESSPDLNQQQHQQQYNPEPPCNDDYTEDTGYYSAACDLSDSSDFDYMYDYAHDDGIFYDDSSSGSSSSSSSNTDQSHKKAGSVTCEQSLAAGLAATASFFAMAEPPDKNLDDEASTSTDKLEGTQESDKADAKKRVFGSAAVDARAMLVLIVRLTERSEGRRCLGVGCLAHRRPSRHSQTWRKRRADDRPTRSRVRAGKARIAAGIG